MTNLVNLFPNANEIIEPQRPARFIADLTDKIKAADMLMIVTIVNQAGQWHCEVSKCNMTNAELNLAMDIVKKHLMSEMQS